MSSSASNPSFDCRFQPVIVMKDFMIDCPSQRSTGGASIIKMRCALCKTRGDPAKFFGRYCTMECAKTDKMLKGTQTSPSDYGAISEKSGSGPQSPRERESSHTQTQQPKKSHSSSSNDAIVGGANCRNTVEQPPVRQSYESTGATRSESIERNEENLSPFREGQEDCVKCRKPAGGERLYDRECAALHARRNKLSEKQSSPGFCYKCKSLPCKCILSSPSLSKHKQVLSDEDANGHNAMPITNGSHGGEARKRKRLFEFGPGDRHEPTIPHVASDISNSFLASRSKFNGSRTSLIKPRNNADNLSSNIRVDNIRSMNFQIGKPPQHQSNQQYLQSESESERFFRNPEKNSDGQNTTGYRCRCVRNGPTQNTDNEAFVEGGSEPESPPNNNGPPNPGHINRNACFAGRPPIYLEDFKSGGLPENSEIYRLHCEEIKSRIAVNQAKRLYFESELERSRLEQKLLIPKDDCDRTKQVPSFQHT